MNTMFKRSIALLALMLALLNADAQICNIDSYPPHAGIHPASEDIPCIVQNEPTSISLQFLAGRWFTQINPVRWIRIDSIPNLPCGINWATNKQVDSTKNTFFAGEQGCISFFGTTNDPTGIYRPKIYITAKLGNGTWRFVSDRGNGGWAMVINTSYWPFRAPALRLISNTDVCAPLDTSIGFLSASCRSLDTASQAYFGELHGRVFYDENQNGIEDGNDFPLQDHKLFSNNQTFAFTNANGSYNTILPIDNYTIQPETASGSYHVTTGSASVQHTVTGGSIDTITFGLFPNAPVTDVRIESTNSRFRPGFRSHVWLSIINEGNTLIDTLTVTCSYHDTMIYVSATPAPTSTNGKLMWNNITYLRPGENRTIDLTFRLPANIDLFDSTMYTYAVVDTFPAEVDTSDNTVGENIFVFGSYDPNDKTAFPTGDLDKPFINSNTPLKYRIRFQNTGTDTAFNVVIRDVIDDTKFDVNSIKMLGASHNYQLKIQDGTHLSWEFANILLPDSNVNEPASHGYVLFEMNLLPSVGEGDEIKNAADIYFDYNPPVVTDTAISKVVYTVGIVEPLNTIKPILYPNPTDHMLYVRLPKANSISIDMVDLSGRTVLQVRSEGAELTADVSNLQAGIYLVRITDGQGNIANRKVLINK